MKAKLLTTVMVGTLLSTVVAASPAPATTRAALPALVWGDCPPPLIERDPRQECVKLPVPLDHRAARSRTIDLAVSRIATARPGLRRGVLVLNTGGPGALGVDAPSFFAGLLPRAVLDRFDLVSFDPRGVGYSAPISCDFPSVAPEVGQRYPDVDGSIDRNVAFARDLARRCGVHGGEVLPFVTTANTARDMDLVRAALGEQRISYLGYSYGTYLGAVYRTMFPRRADRFVLDSNYDPALSRYDQLRLPSVGMALRLPDFTRWAAARNDRYHLGSTSAAVRRTYDTLTARLDTTPVVLPDGTEITGNLLRIVTYEAMYEDAQFPGLAGTWQLLVAATSGSRPPASLPALTAADRVGAAPRIPADNQPSVQLAIHCGDTAWPRDIATYRRNVAIDRRIFPVTAGFPANIWPCAFWPYPQIEPAVRVTGHGTRNVLVVQNLRDPATALPGAVGMKRALGSDAVLLSVDQGGHNAYLLTASTCANDTVTAFLAGGVLPAGPRLCPGQALPA